MTIKSFTDETKSYETTPETCTCPAKYWNPNKQCKHQTALIHELNRVTHFLLLKMKFDCRSQVVIEAKRAAYWNFEMSIQAA